MLTEVLRSAIGATMVERTWLNAIALLCAFASSSHAQLATDTAKSPNQTTNTPVDLSTYMGWRAFHSSCHTCHGVDATGTSVAPNLVERIQDLSAREFSIKVLTSYRVVMQSGEARGDSGAIREEFLNEALRRESGELVMPAWEGDPQVKPFLLDLYSYLRARGAGTLGPGKPTLKSDE